MPTLLTLEIGTLTLGLRGESRFFGQTARVEVGFSVVLITPHTDQPAMSVSDTCMSLTPDCEIVS